MSKIPTPDKENSRAWAWALQQNIMGPLESQDHFYDMQ